MADHSAHSPPETDAGAHTEVPAEAVEHGHFPPFDPTNFAPQLIWLALTFGLLYLLMSRMALPRIGTVLEERQDKIADDLDAATALKKEADDALAAYERALEAARERAHAIAGETRDKLKAETEQLKADLDRQITAKTAEAEVRIARTKEAALANLRGIAIEVAGLVASKLLGETTEPDGVARAVDSELAGQ